jgi:hypothetical protein
VHVLVVEVARCDAPATILHISFFHYTAPKMGPLLRVMQLEPSSPQSRKSTKEMTPAPTLKSTWGTGNSFH